MGIKIEIGSASATPEAMRRRGADGEVWTIHYPAGAGGRGLLAALGWLLIRHCTDAEVPAEGDRIAISPAGALRYPEDQAAGGVPGWVESLVEAHLTRLMRRVHDLATLGPKRPLTERELPSCGVVLRSRPK